MAFRSKNQNQRRPVARNRPRAPVTSYYRTKNPNDKSSPFTPQAPKRRLRPYIFGLVDLILLTVLVIGVIYSLIISPNPAIKADSLTFHSLSAYNSAAAAQLSHLNNRNKITFNETALANTLKKQFPEIRAVRVELPLFSERPTITLTTSRPTFFLDSQGTRYIIDSAGKAVTKAAALPNIKNLPVIDDLSGFRTAPSQQVLSKNGVDFIKILLAQCRLANVAVAQLSIPPVAQELDLKAQNQSYLVKFYLGGDVITQTGQYLAARQHFNETKQPPSQYLDVRVQGKIFYK